MQQFTGLEYLQMDLAKQFSDELDKSNFESRLEWFDEFKDDLDDLVSAAHEPELFLASLIAYKDTLAGKPTGHLIGFDSCASGLQLFAALTGCHVTAKNTGLIGNQRMDMYKECTEAMARIVQDAINVSRKLVKSAQMPHFYGSVAKPKEVFGADTPDYYAFHQANEEVAPGACEALDVLMDSWQAYALDHRFALPDGFYSINPVMVEKEAKIEVDELDHATFTFLYEENEGTEEGVSIAAKLNWLGVQ